MIDDYCRKWLELWNSRLGWPLPNLYLGVSVENPVYWNRAFILKDIPSAKKFISIEPLLGYMGAIQSENIDQIIIGCESGPKRRPCKIEWVRSLVEQAKEAGVNIFVKQLDINGKVSHDMNEWPEDLRLQEAI